MSYKRPVKFTSTDNYGCGPEGEDDVYTVAEFMECVKSSAFIDYDGYGHPVKDGLSDPMIDIYPSQCPDCIPADATHIVWFNR